MKERNDFWDNIPQDCEKAIRELKRLKVDSLIARDFEETFADVWWLVLHEVDLYAEGEYCQEVSRCDWADPTAMNIRHAKSADKWLVKWLPLFNKYKSEEYCGEDLFYYDGQL